MDSNKELKKSFKKEEDLESIHRTIIPADVREGEPIKAIVQSRNDQMPFKKSFRVWKLSPLGIELLDTESSNLQKGYQVNLFLEIGKQKITFTGLVVDNIIQNENRKIICIRITKNYEKFDFLENDRRKKRWLCSEEFLPTGVFANPARFNDFIYFRVKDISHGGIKIMTSLRNKFLVEGMKIETIISFPMFSQLKINFEINNLHIEKDNGKDYLFLGLKFINPGNEVLDTITQYLLQFGSINSLTELSKEGLTARKISYAVDFSYVKSEADYEEVLYLRKIANVGSGKLDPQIDHKDLSDSFDIRSRIIMGRYKGKLVCTARMTFNEADDPFEEEMFCQWPSHLPRRIEAIEVARASTHPDFRNSDLLAIMFKHIAITVVNSKRPWIVLSCTEELIPLYSKIGFSYKNIKYYNPLYKKKLQYVMIANVPQAMSGKNINPFYWNILWKDVSKFMRNYEMITLDSWSNIRVIIFSMLGPIAAFFYARIRTSNKKKQ